MAVERAQDAEEETTETPEVVVFSFRVRPRDRRYFGTILRLDPEVESRTEAVRAALKDYARKLELKAKRSSEPAGK